MISYVPQQNQWSRFFQMVAIPIAMQMWGCNTVIQGPIIIRSHWMPPPWKCLHHITSAATTNIDDGEKTSQKTTHLPVGQMGSTYHNKWSNLCLLTKERKSYGLGCQGPFQFVPHDVSKQPKYCSGCDFFECIGEDGFWVMCVALQRLEFACLSDGFRPKIRFFYFFVRMRI